MNYHTSTSYWQLLALVLCGLAAFAQDTRSVVEPRIPEACTVLEARLRAPLTESAEHNPDTQRIQQAMDRCAAGKAVVLRAASGNGVFLSRPLQLRAGVTLVVEKGAAVFASRNPRDYDLAVMWRLRARAITIPSSGPSMLRPKRARQFRSRRARTANG